jgi:hypothetical protein
LGDDCNVGESDDDEGEPGGVDIGPKWYVSPFMSSRRDSVCFCGGFLPPTFLEFADGFGGISENEEGPQSAGFAVDGAFSGKYGYEEGAALRGGS